ncbi:MAG TPA: alpha/beta hydrolase [Balneolaceae bacterium]|nr:alpha/beta hydrolase [Balneolaceae bacterium]
MNTKIKEDHTYIDGNKIAFREMGTGNPLLLIHGIPTNSLMWREIIPILAKNHRVIAPDLLNYGKSGKPAGDDVSINAQSRMIVDFMDSVGAPAAHIAAHDIGGGIAQLVAVNHPEKIKKLVLMDSVCFDSWPIPEFEPLQEPGAESDMSLDDFLSMMRDFMPNGVHNKSVMTDELIGIYLEPWSTEEGKRAFFRNLRRLNSEYTRAIADELVHISQETLVIWGENDPFQKPVYAEKLAGVIPNTELIWVKNAGHWLIDEKPEEVGNHIQTFFS